VREDAAGGGQDLDGADLVPGHWRTILRTAVRVPDDERDARRTTVAGAGGERIRRKPVLDDLVSEYPPGARKTRRSPAGS
jgi:hypothetical protein